MWVLVEIYYFFSNFEYYFLRIYFTSRTNNKTKKFCLVVLVWFGFFLNKP